MTTKKMPSLLDSYDGAGAPQPKKRTARAGLGDALSGGAGRIVLIVICIAAFAFGAYSIFSTVREGAPIKPRVRYMHPDTGQMAWYTVGSGAPPAGMHPVEYCFQNQCGPAGGTPVILNSYLGKPGPTTCPVCGAEVVGHNPRPEEYRSAVPADW